MIRYTFLSKWTVLALTATAGVMSYLATSQSNALLFGLIAFFVYGFAWFIALLDTLQEHKWGWTIGLILMLPILIGPLVYSFLGPKNTK